MEHQAELEKPVKVAVAIPWDEPDVPGFFGPRMNEAPQPVVVPAWVDELRMELCEHATYADHDAFDELWPEIDSLPISEEEKRELLRATYQAGYEIEADPESPHLVFEFKLPPQQALDQLAVAPAPATMPRARRNVGGSRKRAGRRSRTRSSGSRGSPERPRPIPILAARSAGGRGVSASVDRRALLERCGRLYGSLGLAIAWTVTNRAKHAEDPLPKRVTTSGWQHTTPLADAHHGESIFGQGITRNPAVVLRPSGLVGIECDTEEGFARIAALELPSTVTVCSSLPYKRHYWFRPPSGLAKLESVCFRLEKQGLAPTKGATCSFRPRGIRQVRPIGSSTGTHPDEVEIAELPLAVYEQLVAEHQRSQRKARAPAYLAHNPEAKILEAAPRQGSFRYRLPAAALTADESEIVEAALPLERLSALRTAADP